MIMHCQLDSLKKANGSLNELMMILIPMIFSCHSQNPFINRQ